jgi:hypothetical protein
VNVLEAADSNRLSILISFHVHLYLVVCYCDGYLRRTQEVIPFTSAAFLGRFNVRLGLRWNAPPFADTTSALNPKFQMHTLLADQHRSTFFFLFWQRLLSLMFVRKKRRD